MDLAKIDPVFRRLTDLLFFTDRMDIDASNFLELLGKTDDHYEYLWDRFLRSVEINWDETFWLDRFDLLLKNNPRDLKHEVEKFLLVKFRRQAMWYSFKGKEGANNEYTLLVAWSKAKAARKENISQVKSYLMEFPFNVKVETVSSTIQDFIPSIFANTSDFVSCLVQNSGQYARTLDVLKSLEKLGMPVEKTQLYKLAGNLLTKQNYSYYNRRSFFTLLADPDIFTSMKTDYHADQRTPLLSLVMSSDYKELENNGFLNMHNLLQLDASIADEMMDKYVQSLYSRGYGNKKANVQRLITLCRNYPQFSTKKVLMSLADHGSRNVGAFAAAFPELQNLVAFV